MMCSEPEHVGVVVRELLQRLVELREHEAAALLARDAEALPDFAVWRRTRNLRERLSQTLAELSGTPVLARTCVSLAKRR